jgi:hypothetical protein
MEIHNCTKIAALHNNASLVNAVEEVVVNCKFSASRTTKTLIVTNFYTDFSLHKLNEKLFVVLRLE